MIFMNLFQCFVQRRAIIALKNHYTLLIGLLFGAFIHGSFLNGAFIGLHDAKLHSLNFISFYRHAFHAANLPQFLPHGGFGLPALSNQCYLGATDYLAGLFGIVTRIHNPVIVWNLSVALQIGIFISGCYLCARLFTTSHLTSLIVAVIAASTPIWQFAYEFNFTVIYFLPLTFYFILSFQKTKNWYYIAFAISAGTGGIVGSPVYMLPLVAAILSTFVMLCFISDPCGFSRKNLRPALFIVVISIFLVLIYFSSSMISTWDMLFLFPGRDMETKIVPPLVYLTYGGNIQDQNPVQFLAGQNLLWHGLTYINPVLIGLALGSLVFAARSRLLTIVATSIVLVFAISRGGSISLFLYYYFPAMHFFRHLGLIQSLVIPLLIMGAAIGLACCEKSFSNNCYERWSHLIFKSSVTFLFFVGIFDILAPQVGRALFGHELPNIETPLNGRPAWALSLAVLAAIFYIFSPRLHRFAFRYFQLILLALLFYFGFLLSKQFAKDFKSGYVSQDVVDILKTPFSYQPRRQMEPSSFFYSLSPFLPEHPEMESIYNTQMMNALGIDGLFPYGMYHFMAKSTVDYLKQEWIAPRLAWKDQLPPILTNKSRENLGFDADIIRWLPETDDSRKISVTQLGLDKFFISFPSSDEASFLSVSLAPLAGWSASTGDQQLNIKKSGLFGFIIEVPANAENVSLAFRRPLHIFLSYSLMILSLASGFFFVGSITSILLCRRQPSLYEALITEG